VKEVAIGQNTYRIGRMIPLQQVHVACKIAPAVAVLLPGIGKLGDALKKLSTAETQAAADGATLSSERLNPADFEPIFGSIANALAAMKDEDVNFVIAECLAVVQRKSGTAWQPVWNRAAKAMQFEDLAWTDMLMLTIQVIQDNLLGFS
jgi:hypothetical protein